MTNLEPHRERSSFSSEELQIKTIQAYHSLPEGVDEILPSVMTAYDKQFLSEPIPVLIEFKRLVGQSPGTDSFKKALLVLVHDVYSSGKKPDSSSRRYSFSDDALLVEVLQLKNGSSVGIYTPEGAKKGEDTLYPVVKHELVVSVTSSLDLGASDENLGDYQIFSGWGKPNEIKALLQQWREEYINLYNKQPPGEEE